MFSHPSPAGRRCAPHKRFAPQNLGPAEFTSDGHSPIRDPAAPAAGANITCTSEDGKTTFAFALTLA